MYATIIQQFSVCVIVCVCELLEKQYTHPLSQYK